MDQNNNQTSSPSSSMRSLSTAGGPEYSSLLFNNIPPEHTLIIPPMRPISTLQHQQFPQIHDHHDAMILRSIQNVLSTPPSHHQQNLLPYNQASGNNSAFGRYYNRRTTPKIESNFRRQSLMKRSLSFFRKLNFIRMTDRNQATMRPSSNHLHMISERRRREKLNENFQALRALLPQGTKKDKASILITAKETLQSLMAEIEKLSKRNQELMISQQLQPNKESINFSTNEILKVQIIHVLESMVVNLQVNVMGQISQVDILIRLLELLNQDHHVKFISMNATNTNNAEQGNIHQLTLRLRITQGSEWDEDAFREAVRRVVADLINDKVDQNL